MKHLSQQNNITITDPDKFHRSSSQHLRIYSIGFWITASAFIITLVLLIFSLIKIRSLKKKLNQENEDAKHNKENRKTPIHEYETIDEAMGKDEKRSEIGVKVLKGLGLDLPEIPNSGLNVHEEATSPTTFAPRQFNSLPVRRKLPPKPDVSGIFKLESGSGSTGGSDKRKYFDPSENCKMCDPEEARSKEKARKCRYLKGSAYDKISSFRERNNTNNTLPYLPPKLNQNPFFFGGEMPETLRFGGVLPSSAVKHGGSLRGVPGGTESKNEYYKTLSSFKY